MLRLTATTLTTVVLRILQLPAFAIYRRGLVWPRKAEPQ